MTPAKKKKKAVTPAPAVPALASASPPQDLQGEMRERLRAEVMGDFIRYTLKAASDFRSDLAESAARTFAASATSQAVGAGAVLP